MPRLESRDEQVARKAADFADQIRAVAATADTEEEIRIAVERQLAFVGQEVGVELEGRHEFTSAKIKKLASFYGAPAKGHRLNRWFSLLVAESFPFNDCRLISTSSTHPRFGYRFHSIVVP